MSEGTGSGDINALVALPDRSYVAGGADNYDGWIGRYDDSGAQIWLTWPTPEDEDGYSPIIDLVADSSDGYWALVSHIGREDLIHLDAEGQVDARWYLPDVVQPAGFGVSARQLLVIDRQIWLAGVGGNAPDLWVGRFDIETQTLETIINEDHAGFQDVIWAIARGESEVAVAATVDTSPTYEGDMGLIPHSNVLVIRFDLQGQEVGRHLLGSADPEMATAAHSIVEDGSGGWIVGGDQHPTAIIAEFGSQTAWVARINPSEGWTWTWTSSGPPSGGASVSDMLISDHELVVVGQGYGETGSRYWSTGLGLDGVQHWEQNWGEPTFLEAEVTAVALDASNRLRITSSAWNWNEDNRTLLQSCLLAW